MDTGRSGNFGGLQRGLQPFQAVCVVAGRGRRPGGAGGARRAAWDAARAAAAREGLRYAGGELPGIKVLGAYLGEDEWCSAQLCKRVRQALKPLDGIVQLEDAPKLEIAQQAQQCLLRF